jgi:hypothetical protein
MLLHSDRQATPQSAKRGPPLRGCHRKHFGLRQLDLTGQPVRSAQASLPKSFL